jgi:uncharacterized protein
MDRRLETKQLFLFFALAYFFAWLIFVPFGLSKSGLGWIPIKLSLPVTAILGTLCPSIAALVTLRMTAHRWPKLGHIENLLRFGVAFMLCPLIIGAVFTVAPSLVLVKGPAAALHWRALLSLSVFDYSTLLGGPLGEEPGWRGFALPRLQRLMQPWKASVLLGILWACWHLPLFLSSEWTSSTIPQFVLILVGLSVVMAFVFNLSGQNVLVAICLHAMFNTTSRWMTALLADVPLRENLSAELVIGVCGIVAAVLLIVFSKGRLGLPAVNADV